MTDLKTPSCNLVDVQSAIEAAVREQPGLAGTFQICLRTEAGSPIIQTVCFPLKWLNERLKLLVRYCAVQINNIAMTLGGPIIECYCQNTDLLQLVMADVDGVLPRFYGRFKNA